MWIMILTNLLYIYIEFKQFNIQAKFKNEIYENK